MKAHSRGPCCPPWSLKSSQNEWGCIILNGNIWGKLPWNLPGNRQIWSMEAHLNEEARVWSSHRVLVTTPAQVVPTHVVITHRGQQFSPHSCHWSHSLLLNMGTAAFSPEGVPEGPQVLNWGVKGICVLEGWSWEIRGASDSEVSTCQLPVAT